MKMEIKENQIKQAFKKIKLDIFNINKELTTLRLELNQLKNYFLTLTKQLQTTKIPQKSTSTHKQLNSTHPAISTHSSTHNFPLQPPNSQNLTISTGNQGVSTDRQTDRQTNRQTQNQTKIQEIQQKTTPQTPPEEILSQLDSLKKETRLKFKRLTNQEMLVFSTIYQLEQEGKQATYKTLSNKLGLSESSIRDYIKRMITKDIPILKEKINNKKIILHVADSLKKLATLDTLISLREL